MTRVQTADQRRRARFEAVMATVYEPLQRYLARRADPETAADALADAALVVWRRLDEVPDGAELPWCYAVARRCLANQRRGRDRRLRLVQRVAAHTEGAGTAPSLTSAADAELHDALGRLGDDDRELLRLWAWEQLTPAEIAVVFGLTPNAVSIRLHRARQKLAESLGAATGGKDAPLRGHERGGSPKEVAT